MTTLLFLNLSIEMVLGFITGILITLPILFLLVCYYFLAPRNIFFTFGRENRAMYVMAGKEFTDKIILPSKTIYVDREDKNLIKKFDTLSVAKRKEFKQSSLLGMHWIGIYPFYSIHERRQQWLEWKSLPGGGRHIILRDEMTPFLFCKPFEYAMLVEEAEDANGMPLNIYFTVTLMPTSATLPIFGNDNAYGQVQTKCLSEVLLFTKEKTFTSLGGENRTPDIVADEFSTLLRKLNTQIPGSLPGEGIMEVLGYKITDAKLDKVEIAGSNKQKLLDASIAEYAAKENAKAKAAEAEGNFKATEFDAKGKKLLLDVDEQYLNKVTVMPGGAKILQRRATPNLTTLVENSDKKDTNLLIGEK